MGQIHEFMDELNQCAVPFRAVHTDFFHELQFVPQFIEEPEKCFFFCGRIHTKFRCSIRPGVNS